MTRQEFETAAKELRQLMYDVGLRYFHSQEDAEDVAQESLLRPVEILREGGCKHECQSVSNEGGKKLLHKHETKENHQSRY